MAMNDQPAMTPGDSGPTPSPDPPDLLTHLFSSRTRALLLAFLVPRLDKRFSLTELSRALDAPVSSLQHECYKLERLGFLIGHREGASRRYQVDAEPGFNKALVRLVVSALGLERCLNAAFSGTVELQAALIAGSLPPSVDVPLHLVLIGDLALEQVQSTLELIARLIGMPPDRIELAFFQPADWNVHRERGHPLVERLRRLPILVAFGAVRDESPASEATISSPA